MPPRMMIFCTACERPLAKDLNYICTFCESKLILESEEARRAPLVEPTPTWPAWVLERTVESDW